MVQRKWPPPAHQRIFCVSNTVTGQQVKAMRPVGSLRGLCAPSRSDVIDRSRSVSSRNAGPSSQTCERGSIRVGVRVRTPGGELFCRPRCSTECSGSGRGMRSQKQMGCGAARASCSTVPTRCTATFPSRAHSCVTLRRRSARSASDVIFESCGPRRGLKQSASDAYSQERHD